MSRQKGTPNRPKVEIPSGYTDDKFEIERIDLDNLDEPKKYILIQNPSMQYFERDVNIILKANNYICQGGVSVTNYRANDGSIVMVYCQALVRKDMV